jgi:transposase
MEKKTYTLHEIAEHYKVSIRTLNNWLKPIRKQVLEMNPASPCRLRILLPKQVIVIKEYLG